MLDYLLQLLTPLVGFFLVIFASQTQSTSELPLTEGFLQVLNEVLSTDAESTNVAVSVASIQPVMQLPPESHNVPTTAICTANSNKL